MADNRIKDFGFTWNLKQFFQCRKYVSEIRSPKIRVYAANHIRFCLSYTGKEAFEVKIEKNDDLELSLGDCDVSCTSDNSISFTKQRHSDLPGWSVQCKSSLNGKTASGDLKIIIQLFLREYLNQDSTIPPSDNVSYQKLSRDMKQLLNAEKFTDLKLVVGDEEFRVHKAIIAARAPKLADTLELGSSSSHTKEVTFIRAPVLKYLLRYLYSGEFDITHKDIPVGLSTTLDTLKLDVLGSKLYVYPNHTLVSTQMRTAVHSFVWPIKNFDSLLPGTVLTSPIVYPHHLCELQLRLRKETMVNSSGEEDIQVEIALDTTYERENCYLHFDTCLVDVFGESTHARSFDAGEPEWKTVLIVKRSELALQPQDTLSLFFKLTTQRPESEIVGSESSSASLAECCGNPCDLTSLSVDLHNLYQSGQFSDLTVHAGTQSFKVHKAIISARSPKLFEAFELQASLNSSLAVTDMEPAVLGRLLEYIYSGKAVQSNCASATKLYLSAYKYDLSPLKVNCLSYIKSNITF